MISDQIPVAVLVRILYILVALLALIVAIDIVVIIVRKFRIRRQKRQVEALNESVQKVLAGDAAAVPVEALERTQILLFSELARTFSPDAISRLKSTLHTSTVVQHASRLAASRWWWNRLRGLRILTILAEKVEPRPSWFTDPQLEVRAQAAEWVASASVVEALPKLTVMLNDPVGLCRFTVQDSLHRLRKVSEGALADFVAGARGAGLLAALRIATTFHSSALCQAVLRHVDDPDPEIRTAVADALGSFAGEEVAGAIEKLLHDERPQVRALAAASAGKLRLLDKCGRLATMLRDRDWDVRKQTAYGLLMMGAPGIITLRAALSDADPYARDIAKQMLQIGAIEERV